MNIIQIAQEVENNKKIVITRSDWKAKHVGFVFPAIFMEGVEDGEAEKAIIVEPAMERFAMFACNIEGVFDKKGIEEFAPCGLRLVDLLAEDWEILFT